MSTKIFSSPETLNSSNNVRNNEKLELEDLRREKENKILKEEIEKNAKKDMQKRNNAIKEETNKEEKPIDAKNTTSNKKTDEVQTDWSLLAKDFVNSFVFVLIAIIVGARVIFATKVAQFNVLPTDINCMPYRPVYGGDESKSPDFQSYSPVANIDEITINNGIGNIHYSTKIKYDINKENMHYKILDYIRKIEYDPKVGTYVKFAMSSISKIYVLFYGTFNWLFEKFNRFLPEWLLFLISTEISILLLVLILPIGFVGSLIVFLTNYKILMQRNMNNDPDYKYKDNVKPVWRDVDIFSNIPNFLTSVFYLILGWITSFTIIFTPIPYIIGLICFFSPFFMKAIYVTGPKEGKPYNFFSSLKGMLESKMFWIILLFLFRFVSSVSKNYNEKKVSLPITIAVAIASAIFAIYMYFSQPKIPPAATSEIASYDKNLKYCPKPLKTAAEKAAEQRDSAYLNEPKTMEETLNMFKKSLPIDKFKGVQTQIQQNTKTDQSQMPNPAKVPVVSENLSNTTSSNIQKGGGVLEKKIKNLREVMTSS